jgi:hypothetical protein
MGLIKIIFFLLIFSSNALLANNKYFDRLKNTTNLKEDEQLVIIYQDIGNCIKCYLKPLDQVKSLKIDGKIKKYKLIAMVRCERDIELKIYKKQTQWKDYLYKEDGSSRSLLGVKTTTTIVVLDYFGNIQIEL